MVRSSSRPRKSVRARSADVAVNPRTLFLASLGALARSRREAERLAAEAGTVPERLRAGADAAVDAARNEVKKLSRSATSRFAPIRREVDKWGTQVEKARVQGVTEAAKRLNPLLVRVGLPPIVAKTAVKPAAKRSPKPATSRRPAAKKAVKATRRRA